MTDSQQLLAEYAQGGSDTAFRELVARYVNLVYSTALRLVGGDTHRAEDVAQTVFADLARQARTLSSEVMLGGWLHRHTCFVAAHTLRGERRRHLRERQAVEMNALHNDSGADFSLIAPILDEVINALEEGDRSAILLRFFEQRDFRSVGEALGSTEDAARMRVNRALEKLHDLLKRRGITATAATLGVALSANAIQAAPAGLVATLSSAAALAGTALANTAAATAAKAIAMTTLQKTLITATVAVLAGGGIYEARQASQLRDQVQNFRQQQTPMAEEIRQLQRERDESARQLAALREDNERLNRNTGELLRLRSEVTRFRNAPASAAAAPASELLEPSNPLWKPNWIALFPFDLAQFPDSGALISSKAARDVGTATPSALLQTWIWAHRTGDAAGLLKTSDFPEGTTEAQKMQHVLESQRSEEHARQSPDRVSFAETSRLRDMFVLGDDYYLAFIEEKQRSTGTYVGYQIFRRVGDEWKVSFGRPAK